MIDKTLTSEEWDRLYWGIYAVLGSLVVRTILKIESLRPFIFLLAMPVHIVWRRQKKSLNANCDVSS